MPSDFGVGVEIEGFDELQASLDGMAKGGADRVIRKAVRAGAKVFQAAIIERTPVRPALPSGTALPVGAMVADINIGNVRKYDDGKAYSVTIGPGKATAYAARWVEYGHQNFTGGKAKGSGTKSGETPPHPFIRPAFETAEQPAIAAAIEVLESAANEDLGKGAA